MRCITTVLLVTGMLILISTIVMLIYKIRPIQCTYRPKVRRVTDDTNRLYTGSEYVDFVGIALPSRRESHWDVLNSRLSEQGIQLSFFEAINGKEIDMTQCRLGKQYLDFFRNNAKMRKAGKTTVDYRGHLGCTLSHLKIIGQMENMTVIFEDDAEIGPNFRNELQQSLADVSFHDPDWEILVLGCSANYKDHFYHKLNDKEPILKGGIVRLHYWIGLWGYVVRSKKVAEKIMKFFDPIPWHIDLGLAEEARLGNIKVFGLIPPIASHPGRLRISSWDLYQSGDPSKIKTDTNK